MEENLVPGRDGEDTKKRQKTSLRYKLNSYHSIMKLAVVFLCLGISCLVDANAGGPKPGRWTKQQARDAAAQLYDISALAENLKIGSAKEIKANQLCLIEKLDSFLNSLSVTVGCTVEQLLELLGVSPEATRLMQAGDSEGLLELLDLETVVTSILLLVEGLCAHAGILLKPVLLDVHKALGLETSLPSSFSLLGNTIDGVLSSLRDTAIGKVVASITGLLNELIDDIDDGATGPLY